MLTKQEKEKIRKEYVEWAMPSNGRYAPTFNESADYFFSQIDLVLSRHASEIRTLKFTGKEYDGNDLNSACQFYSIAAENWNEIIRFENGFNQAIEQSASICEGKNI